MTDFGAQVRAAPQQLRLLITGDRNWTDGGLIADWLSTLRGDNPDMLLCHGANGMRYKDGTLQEPKVSADALADWAARLLDIPVTPFPAEWGKFGKRAGPIRNRQMLKEFRPTDVLAFHNLLERSKGTKDMMKAAHAAGIPVLHVTTANPTGSEWPNV